MPLKSTSPQYGIVAVSIHWLSAVAILAQPQSRGADLRAGFRLFLQNAQGGRFVLFEGP